jgi:Rod binding domain-containing protein
MNVQAVLASSIGADRQATAPKNDLAQAAREFEALLIGQILKSATESCLGNGLGGSGEDQAGAQALSIAQEQFAAALATNGGLGLAEMVTRSVGDRDIPAARLSSLIPP